MANRTGYIFREEFMWHDTGQASLYLKDNKFIQPGLLHAENPETKRRIDNLLEVSGLKKRLHKIDEFEPLTEEELSVFHTREYIAHIQSASALSGGEAGELAPFGHGSYEIAALSAAATLAGARAVMSGAVENCYVLNRPPGHHAEAERGRGFCIFGNAVLAAKLIRRDYRRLRIATVDWDVHHGNGTQKAFYDDPNTLVISIHQYKNYPQESGFLEETGNGDAVGYNINIPVPPGTGHGGYIYATEEVIVPALEKFKPDLIFILSGFDGVAVDPLGRNMAHSETYRQMTRLIGSVAKNLCSGRIVITHEGGYSAAYVPYCGLAVVEELSGINTDVIDPFLDIFSGYGMGELQSHQKVMIDEARSVINLISK